MDSGYWMDIAAIVFACTTVNHLGLIRAIEGVVRKEIPVIGCPRCLTFWSVLAYGLSGDGMAANPSCLARLLAISILASYLAIWLELAEGYTDMLYRRLYDKIYPAADTADDGAQRA